MRRPRLPAFAGGRIVSANVTVRKRFWDYPKGTVAAGHGNAKAPRCGAFVAVGSTERAAGYTAIGSLKASGSPSSAISLSGMQLQNTFLSPYTLSTRATGGQYFCCFSVASGNTASSRL